MSRVAKAPVPVSKSVQVDIKETPEGFQVTVKGPKGENTALIHPLVSVVAEGEALIVSPKDAESKKGSEAWAQAGTARACLMNLVIGAEKGFERKLQLIGVGYRAQAKGKTLNLTVGYSHPVEMEVPEGVKAETPSQTEIVLSGPNKQVLGQFAANVRSVRPPEPYKGKGIRYSDERVRTKEAKKK